ncbi:DUF427-domain-containing protein [Xylaria venustula]|nr:DUF427-domain-containing protein [Xylaria venustula]
MPSPPKELNELARSLLANGPVKTLPAAPKRIRIGLDGGYAAVTTDAVLVWEHQYYPTYYLPKTAFGRELSYPVPPPGDGYSLAVLGRGEKKTDRVIVFHQGELAGLVRVEFNAVDAWFEEDVRIDVHPKDPFKRVDVLFSSRPISVFVKGDKVASATSSFHLYETGLPVRFYLPFTAVRPELLRESATVTACPYKGEANYYDLVYSDADDGPGEAPERRLKDVIWYYKNPKIECAAIAGCLCFYSEKVDIELDGKMTKDTLCVRF